MKTPLARFFFAAVPTALVVATLNAFVVSPPERQLPLPRLTPIERLLSNARRRVVAEPASAEAHYVVARLNYLVFSTGWTMAAEDTEISVQWNGAKSEWHVLRHRAEELAYEDINSVGAHIPESKRFTYLKARDRREAQLKKSGWSSATSLPSGKMVHHAGEALVSLETAARFAPSNVHYLLCRACLIEQFVEWRRIVKPAKLDTKLASLELKDARELYLVAFNLGFQKGGDQQGRVTGVDAIATAEAGENYLRLSKGAQASAHVESSAVAEVEQGLKQVKSWPESQVIQLITPILLALSPVGGVGELIDTAARVAFPLRGFGPTDVWPWVRPTTGLLVWDPARTGEVASGRQLFGGFTFQIAWSDGYDALAALDDDGDRVLRGAELAGMRVWFDRDGDGRSAPGEVVDLAALGIVGIAVRATGSEGIHPTNPAGVIFSDGRTLPTWDWMVTPHRN